MTQNDNIIKNKLEIQFELNFLNIDINQLLTFLVATVCIHTCISKYLKIPILRIPISIFKYVGKQSIN